MCWGSSYSEAFDASNGIRQGGILSPYLFNVYMDGLSDRLNKSKVGCTINNVVFSHRMHVDDSMGYNVCLLFVKDMQRNAIYLM